MKSLVELLVVLLQECGRKCGAPVKRDVETLRSRVKHEGDSFITITLPTFCRDFERSLDMGRIGPGAFLSFRKERSGIPSFLKGFLSDVFDSAGTLLSQPSVDCIRLVRQICLFGKKIKRPCSRERELDAIEGYRQCEDNVVACMPEPFLSAYRDAARIICGSLRLDEVLLHGGLRPKHGPGATREHISGNQKYVHKRWHRRLSDAGFTWWRYGKGSQYFSEDLPLEYWGSVSWPLVVEPADEEPVRVVFVPKTQKTPRVIAVEPVCMQYAQQALQSVLRTACESSQLTRGHVNFRDQTVNQTLALDSSRDCRLATLDMSEASDRVSLCHVDELLFMSSPVFWNLAMASRSRRAELPNGDIVTLKKFASMGSALCFPIESLVFFTSIIASRAIRAGVPLDASTVSCLGRDVYVFGDDLIVPSDEAPAICADLEAMGFKVNSHKSFWTGKFRESCGVDGYDGQEVTPVYLRSDPPQDRQDAEAVVSVVATANQLFSAGYPVTAAALREAVETVVGRLPQVSETSAAIGWHWYSEPMLRRRWNRHLQRVEYLLWVPVSALREDPIDGEPALAKCFRLLGEPLSPDHRKALAEPWYQGLRPSDAEHLSVSSRPYSLTLKRRWVPAD